MGSILALRPFVPAKDFALSKRFYERLNFRLAMENHEVAIFEADAFSFILQNFYVEALAGNFMVQLLVPDVDLWWAGLDAGTLVEEFKVRPPRAPVLQSWGLKVGFLFDPSGVLWHIAQPPSGAAR